MKYGAPLAVLSTAFLLAGCSIQSTSTNFDAGLVQYDVDPRTGICYAATASAGSGGFDKITMTAVPATKEVLAQIKPARLAELEKSGLKPVTWETKPAPAAKPAVPLTQTP